MKREDLADGITEIRDSLIDETLGYRKRKPWLIPAAILAMAALASVAVILSKPKKPEVIVNPEPSPTAEVIIQPEPSDTPDPEEVIATPAPTDEVIISPEPSDTPEPEEVIVNPTPTPLPFDETRQILSLSIAPAGGVGADGPGPSIYDYEDDGIASLPDFTTMPVLRRSRYGFNSELAKETAERAAALLGQTPVKVSETTGSYRITGEDYSIHVGPEYLSINLLNIDNRAEADEELVREKVQEFLDTCRELFPFENPELHVQKGAAAVYEHSDDEKQTFLSRMHTAGISVNSDGVLTSMSIPLYAELPFEVVDEYPIISYEQALADLKARKSYPQTLEADPEVIHVSLGYYTDMDHNLMYPVYTFVLPQPNPYYPGQAAEYRVVALDERYYSIDYPEAVIVRKTAASEEDELYQRAFAAVAWFKGETPKVEEAYYLKEGDTVEYIVFNLLEMGKKTSAIVLGSNPDSLYTWSEARTQYDSYAYGEPFILYYRFGE